MLDQAFAASDADDRTRAQFGAWAEAASVLVEIESSAGRAAGLLRWLHAGRLKTYRADATTLTDALGRGEYNCVSSALLYNLLAERIGLQVRAELLPTHARSLVKVGSDWIVVETTTPQGFAPDPEATRKILEQVAGSVSAEDRSFVDRAGERHPTRSLVAVTYVNRAIFAQRADRPGDAERLYAAAETLSVGTRFGVAVNEQRAALLSQLAAQAADRGRFEEAVRLLRQALELEGTDLTLRRVLSTNVVAYAQRVLRGQVEGGRVAEVVRGLERHTFVQGLEAESAVRIEAFGWGEVANHHATARRWDASMSAYDRALGQASRLDGALRGTLERNRDRARIGRARQWAGSGRLDEALATVSDPEERKTLYESAVDRAIREGDDGALDATTKACVKAHPESAYCRGNRVAYLQRYVQARLKTDRCDVARPEIQELRGLEPEDRFATTVQLGCWVRKARGQYDQRRYAQAAQSLIEALNVDPADATVRSNLSVVFRAWAGRAEGAACRTLKDLRHQAQRRAEGLNLAGCNP